MRPASDILVRRRFLLRLLGASGVVTAAALAPERALASGARALVRRIRVADAADGVEVRFDTSAPVEHRLFTLHHPDRVVIDIVRARLAEPPDLPALPAGGIARIRWAPHHGHDLRVVLDMRHRVRPASFVRAPDAHHRHYRLVVALKPADAAMRRPTVQASTREAGHRDVVVVIDPGHGGKDPGAIGEHGTREKDVVLDIGRRLHRRLARMQGVRAVMTRDRDVFLPLRERVRIARHHRADLFLSIHADASTDRRVRGASVYILSEHGASSEAARRLANRENMADLVGGVKLEGRDPVLASVLLDLSQTATLEASATFAGDVLSRLDAAGRVFSERVERAGFVVLKAPDVPSTLVETAFISNPYEERRLRSHVFRQHMADALGAGVKAYLASNAPAGTALAALHHADGA